MISGFDPEIVMPKKGKKLTPEQVAVFRAWIDQGMVWPDEINFFEVDRANLHPVELDEMEVPTDFANPVDGFVNASFTASGGTWRPVVDDRTFARRVWVEKGVGLWGLGDNWALISGLRK